MNGDRGAAVKQIMQAIEYGTLPTDETQRRLMELIQKEANRTDGPADEELMSACIDLMERLQGREHVEDEERIAALNQRIADAIQKKQQSQERWHTAFRAVGAIAAVVVLLVGIGVPLRWTWFESWSTPDEQQHVIMGHEITVDMVASAIADSAELDTTTVAVNDFAQIDEILGLPLSIPSVLAGEWIASNGFINYAPGYIKVSLVYKNANDSNQQVAAVINLYSDIEYAYFSFEQSRNGELISSNGIEYYVSDNMGQTSACWYNAATLIFLTGDIEVDQMTNLVISLIGGTYD